MLNYEKTEREPYEIIIEKNYLSRAKRIAEDTKDELSKVLKRVENVNVLLFKKFKKKKKIFVTEVLNQFNSL